jgi:hypothetical protein
MTTPFGPPLIGETEKTLNALLERHLEGSALSEPQWVTLRLADMLDGSVDTEGLAAAVADRAHFTHPDELVRMLVERGFLDDGQLTSAGRELVTSVQASIAADTAVIWDGLAEGDVDAAARVLNEVLSRARTVLGQNDSKSN